MFSIETIKAPFQIKTYENILNEYWDRSIFHKVAIVIAFSCAAIFVSAGVVFAMAKAQGE